MPQVKGCPRELPCPEPARTAALAKPHGPVPAHGPPEKKPSLISITRYFSSCLSRFLPVSVKSEGFTLLELIVVIAVIGGLLAIVFPRITNPGAAYLKSDAGRISSLTVYVNETAASRRVYFRLWFDLDKELLRVESSVNGTDYKEFRDGPKRIKLTDGVLIEDVVTAGLGKVNGGEVSVVIPPSGGEPFAVHLKSGESRLTITYNPLTGKVKTDQGYV